MIVPSNDFEHNFSNYNVDNRSHVPPPKPSLNGGLYTGEAFADKASYRNFPVQPDAVHMIANNLASANPPPGAQSQFPDGLRPGNNMPFSKDILLNKYSDKHAILCTQRN